MKTLNVIANTATAKQINTAGIEIGSGNEDYSHLFYNSVHSIVFKLLKSDLTAFTIPSGATFQLSLTAASDWDPATEAEVRINTLYDPETAPTYNYYTVDIANSTVTFVLFPNTTGIATLLESADALTDGVIDLGQQLKMFSDGIPETLLQNIITLHADRDPGDETIVANDPNYRLAAAQDSIDATKLDKDFSELDTKTALVDADTAAFNDSAASGNPIVITALKIWNYIKSKADAVYSALGHVHAISEVTDLSDELAAKESTANKGVANGYAGLDADGNIAQTVPAAKVSGVLDIANIPATALERLTVVADDTARFALTTATVQLGDSVKVTATGYLYLVKDVAHLNSEDGYEIYAAGTAGSVEWTGVTGKPAIITDIAAISGSDDDIIQRVSGSWVNRTIAQLKTALGLGSAAYLTAGTSANNAVQLTADAKLPAVDGSNLTNLPGGSGITVVETTLTAGTQTAIVLGAFTQLTMEFTVYDGSGNYRKYSYMVGYDGSTVSFARTAGIASATAPAEFDPDAATPVGAIDFDLNTGNLRLLLTLAAGSNLTCKHALITKF